MKNPLPCYLVVVLVALLASCAVADSEGRLTGSDHWYDAKVKPWK